MTDATETVSLMNEFLDDYSLPLFLGIVSPGLLYIGWSLVDIMSLPLA